MGVGTAVAKMQMDFEGSMAKISTLLSDGVNMEKFSNDIIRLSNETGQSVSELSESIYNSLSSGVDESGVLEFVEKANKLATTGYTSVESAVDILTTTLNSYGLELSEVDRISDVLIQTQNKGKVTINELSASMSKIIPTASANGVVLEQLATGYSLMTSKGIACAKNFLAC